MGTVCVVGDYVVAMDPGAPVLRDAAVAIEQGRVIGLGPAREVIEAHRPELVVGGKGRVVVPGLIDAHVHSRERLAAFLFPDTVAPDEWMARYAMPYHASLDERAERVAVELQLATMASRASRSTSRPVTFTSPLTSMRSGGSGSGRSSAPGCGTYPSSTGRARTRSSGSRTSW